MGRQFLPSSDAALLAWSLNFNTLITATPTAFGLTAGLATAYGALHTAYATALAAADPAIRSKPAVATKDSARGALKNNARLLAKIVEGTASVTNAQKLSLGLTVRAQPSPIPVPADAPALDIVSVSGRTVSIRLHDADNASKRGKPPGVDGAAVFSFVGATAPDDPSAYKFEGNTTRTTFDVVFPNTVAAGTQVWLTAMWFNERKQSGPACTPVGATVQFGGMSMAA